jgi:hypothetical protein
MKRLKNPNCCNHGPDAFGWNFWDFIEVDIGFDPKTLFNPYVLFFHHILCQEEIISKVETQLNDIRFP